MPAKAFLYKAPTDREIVHCCSCGVEFASGAIELRRADKSLFYCPNGHSMSFVKTDADLAREQRDEERKLKEWHSMKRQMYLDELDKAKKDLDLTRKALKRAKAVKR
jgi:hypothetical protein